MTRPAFPHDLDLGQPVDPATLETLIQSQRDSELVRGILQTLRNHAAMVERAGRQTPGGAHPLEYRAYHAGGADAVEEVLMGFYKLAHPEQLTGTQRQDGEEIGED